MLILFSVYCTVKRAFYTIERTRIVHCTLHASFRSVFISFWTKHYHHHYLRLRRRRRFRDKLFCRHWYLQHIVYQSRSLAPVLTLSLILSLFLLLLFEVQSSSAVNIPFPLNICPVTFSPFKCLKEFFPPYSFQLTLCTPTFYPSSFFQSPRFAAVHTQST